MLSVDVYFPIYGKICYFQATLPSWCDEKHDLPIEDIDNIFSTKGAWKRDNDDAIFNGFFLATREAAEKNDTAYLAALKKAACNMTIKIRLLLGQFLL